MWNQAIREVLLCPVCDKILQTPVTLECGHTFCKSCVQNVTLCAICRTYSVANNSTTTSGSGNASSGYGGASSQYDVKTTNIIRTNVLIQGLVNRYQNELSANNSEVKTAGPNTEAAINAKLKRRWSKVYRRRGKQHLEESIAAFCLAAIYESQNRSFRQVVGKVLHNLLSTKRSLRTRCQATPSYPCTRTENHRYHTSTASDSEDVSSGDEDFIQGMVSSSELKKLVEKIIRELECVRKLHTNITPQFISPAELECVLCSRCFLEPVTTVCGHTFCRECLERVLDYGASCPLCVAPISRADLSRGSTTIVERLLRLITPTEYNERIRVRQQEIDSIDSQVPVFVCTTAFPGIACPLFVYEPRYRLMTRRCLQSSNGRFAMAASSNQPGEKFAKYGTLLEIRDAVRLQDGCSILTTIGVRRFRVIETGEKDGYDTASVQYIQDSPISSTLLPNLQKLHDKIYKKAMAWVKSLSVTIQSEIEHSFGIMPEPELNWHRLPDGPTWAWWLLAILPLGRQLQIGILGTTSLEKRLLAIDKTLERLTSRTRTYNDKLDCDADGLDISNTCSSTQNRLENHLEPQPTINM